MRFDLQVIADALLDEAIAADPDRSAYVLSQRALEDVGCTAPRIGWCDNGRSGGRQEHGIAAKADRRVLEFPLGAQLPDTGPSSTQSGETRALLTRIFTSARSSSVAQAVQSNASQSAKQQVRRMGLILFALPNGVGAQLRATAPPQLDRIASVRRQTPLPTY
jgi:hypothetical protein